MEKSVKLVDFTYLEGLLGGDRAVMGEVLAIFRQQALIWAGGLDETNPEWRAVAHTVKGAARGILTAERVALNFLCHLSGVASRTAAFVAAVAGTKARITCTRKTVPGLRALQKYAVRLGGGSNHRFGLDDSVLIKDNHVAVAGGIRPAIERARAATGHLVKIEVEVDTLTQLDEALRVGIDAVLLDNMSEEELRRAVAMVDGRAVTEASGRVDLTTVAAIAATGVDLISSGALTHSVSILDIGLDHRG